MQALLLEMLKSREDVEVNATMSFCKGILWHLEDEEEEEYETNQCNAEMKELFWGHVVVDWFGVNFRCDKCRRLNKIIVKRCIEFCI